MPASASGQLRTRAGISVGHNIVAMHESFAQRDENSVGTLNRHFVAKIDVVAAPAHTARARSFHAFCETLQGFFKVRGESRMPAHFDAELRRNRQVRRYDPLCLWSLFSPASAL